VTLSVPAVAGSLVNLPVDDRQMSRLPVVNQPWPPPAYDPVAYMHRIWDAWWTGDRQRLAWVYYNLGANSPTGRSFFATTGEPGMPTPRPGQFRGGLLGSIEYSFWGQPVPPGEKRTRTHVPIAGDIAQTSASLLFAKPPALRSTLEGNAAVINNAYFENLVDDHFHRRLLEAAELCSALGGTFLRVVWDREVRDRPWITSVPVDVAVPEFRYDVLSAVTFWQTLVDDGDTVVRHLEKHVPGSNTIMHGLYQGDQTELGERIPLDADPVTARFAADPTLCGDTIYFPDQPLDASSVGYVPNLTPNRLWRDLGPQAWPLGRSDYSGVEPLMDNLDEVYSSWIRDVRLAKSRIIVPNQYLDNIGRGKGAVFDPERQVYSPLNALHDDSATTANSIVANQFAIRFAEHKATCQDIVDKIVSQAGYSAQTFGDYEGAAPTATEVNAREGKTMLTRSRKINNWRPALQDIIYGLMTIEQTYFGNTAITPERPDIEFIDTIAPSMLQLAQTAQALDSAGAASREVLVQLVHPDWTPDQVAEEVDRIKAETGEAMAAHARISLAAPMGEPLSQEIADLAESDVPPQGATVPGTAPDDASTGGSAALAD
jgi:SPP1 Gp6-like portal protein